MLPLQLLPSSAEQPPCGMRTHRPCPGTYGPDAGLLRPAPGVLRPDAGRSRRPLLSLMIAFCTFAAFMQSSLGADPPTWNRDVLPILAEHCFPCHGSDPNARQAELRLDLDTAARQPAASGNQAILPGQPHQSELIRRITTADPDSRMPPPETQRSLAESQVEVLRAWIADGAEYQTHWSLIPPRRPSLPADPTLSPIDYLVTNRLQNAGFSPAPSADPATLIRRVTLDLTGLPPNPEQLASVGNNPDPTAYANYVDQLLNSPHFGEHWARWWLDLAHYGDSDGYLQDFLRPVAWRYREWVVDSLNNNKPFDQFVIEQLAGDLLPAAATDQIMGTGFLRNTLSNREGGADLEEFRVKQVLDRTSTVATTFLALTIGCAQCHDHKYDAITQREFYQLYAFFNSADEANIDAPLPAEIAAWQQALPAYNKRRDELIAPLASRLQELQQQWEQKILYTEAHPGQDFAWDRTLELLGLQWGQNLGEGQLEGLAIIKTAPTHRTISQQQRLQDYFLRSARNEFEPALQKLDVGKLINALDALAQELPPVTRAPAMMVSPAERTTHIFVRGEYLRPGDVVAANTPALLPPLHSDGPPTRLDLARWLVSPDHPLTARVAVNRVWQQLFGQGLVTTSDNFGVRGDLPSHPELLDWLASELMQHNWNLKSLIRTIVLSRTYQQSSNARPELQESDPANRLLGRQQRLRLSAEAIRDSALAVSGLLNPTIGGPSVKPPQPDSVSREAYANKWVASTGPDRYRRGIYTFLQRTTPFAQFVTFDLPDNSHSCTRRERSNTPLQALTLLNDPVFLEAAVALAERVIKDAPADDSARIGVLFQLTLARNPAPQEQARLLQFLNQQQQIFTADPTSAALLAPTDSSPDTAAWTALASIMLNLDEFLNRP